MARTLLLLNTTGRQAASIARVASAVGFSVRAHVADTHHSPLVAGELADLANITIMSGSLANQAFLEDLFIGVDLAFVNTTAFDDEAVVGMACADLAVRNSLQHVIYSSMPDHEIGDQAGKGWEALPQWKGKALVERYMSQKLGNRVTFVHTGVYHNNFTSLPYPLFQLREVMLGPNGEWINGTLPDTPGSARGNGPSKKRGNLGFEWCAPFPPDKPLPWFDCEHDMGSTVLQVFKDGPETWGGMRVPIAFDYLTPPEVCAAFSRALDVPVRYVQGPITISVPVPAGYAEELATLQRTLGGPAVDGLSAPYWWAGFFEPVVKPIVASPDHHPAPAERDATVGVARNLWPGWRSMEEYAGDAFIVEERLNGKTWMGEDSNSEGSEEVEESEESEEGLELAAARPL